MAGDQGADVHGSFPLVIWGAKEVVF
jgi:hypothetical protein